jgi:hypothetical protein
MGKNMLVIAMLLQKVWCHARYLQKFVVPRSLSAAQAQRCSAHKVQCCMIHNLPTILAEQLCKHVRERRAGCASLGPHVWPLYVYRNPLSQQEAE